MKKYELTSEIKNHIGHKLHRIKALKDFGYVKAGELGGWVESEKNLSQNETAWIFDEAKVYGNAKIYDCAEVHDNVLIYDDAEVFGHAKISDNAEVFHNAKICDRARVHGYVNVYNDAQIYDEADVCGCVRINGNTVVHEQAKISANINMHGNVDICGDAKIFSEADYIVFKNFWSSGRYFTWTRSNNMWRVGCFYGTGKELIKKAYADSEKSGKEYERVVRYVESILADETKR